MEDPWVSAPADEYDRTVAISDAPEKSEIITLTFLKGVPTQLNSESLLLANLIMKLDKIAS